jgi:hypothetical protein
MSKKAGKSRRVFRPQRVTVWIDPVMREAIESYASRHWIKKPSLDGLVGATLLIALMILPELSRRMRAYVHYRKAEGFDDSHGLVHAEIRRSLAKLPEVA